MNEICTVCNRKFQSAEALAQHMLYKKDKKHAYKRNTELQSDKSLSDKSLSRTKSLRYGFSARLGLGHFGRFILLETESKKRDLTEDEKSWLIQYKARIKDQNEEDRKRFIAQRGLPEDTTLDDIRRIQSEEERKRIIIQKGLPEDTTWNEIRQLEEEKSLILKMKVEEQRQIIREINRRLRRDAKEFREKEDNLREEQKRKKQELLKKDVEEWKEWRAKHPFQPDNIPEKNIELPPCPIKCDKSPLKNRTNKNRLLDMSTG